MELQEGMKVIYVDKITGDKITCTIKHIEPFTINFENGDSDDRALIYLRALEESLNNKTDPRFAFTYYEIANDGDVLLYDENII